MLPYSSFSLQHNNVPLNFRSLRRLPGLMVLFLLLGLLLSATVVRADNGSALYDVEVLVVDESPDVRLQAFTQGMNEVLIRISGNSIVTDKLKLPAPSRYVKQFSYEPVENPSVNAAGETLSHRLKVQYNGTLLEKYLLDNGFPVWSEHRKELVIWLVVRDGNNEYILKDADKSLIKSMVNTALARRGVPRRWPVYDVKDKKLVTVADLRGGFQDQVVAASKRYSNGPSLAASLNWDGKQWQSTWSLLLKERNRHWSLADADYNQLIIKAMDQAADALGVVFAIGRAADNQPMETIQLNVGSVNSIEKYRRVEDYLSALSAVERVKVHKVDAASVTFDLTLRSNKADFINLLKNDAELVEVEKVLDTKKPVVASEVDTGNPVSLTTGVIDRSKTNLLVNQQNQVPVYNYQLIN